MSSVTTTFHGTSDADSGSPSGGNSRVKAATTFDNADGTDGTKSRSEQLDEVVQSTIHNVAGTARPTILFPERDSYLSVVSAMHEGGCEMLEDLTAVDYLRLSGRELPGQIKPERFEVVVHLLSLSVARRFELRVQVPEEDPTIDTLYDVYHGSEAMEREVFDMFGIVFTNHPDMTRILMPDDWEGYPLRKDYGVNRVPVQFREAPGPR